MLPAAERLATSLAPSAEKEWEEIASLSSFHSRMNAHMHCARCLVPRSYYK